jgi:hypothetical protein
MVRRGIAEARSLLVFEMVNNLLGNWYLKPGRGSGGISILTAGVYCNLNDHVDIVLALAQNSAELTH